jgi:hypothetical protein
VWPEKILKKSVTSRSVTARILLMQSSKLALGTRAASCTCIATPQLRGVRQFGSSVVPASIRVTRVENTSIQPPMQIFRTHGNPVK